MPRSVQIYAWSLAVAGGVLAGYYVTGLTLASVLPMLGLAVIAVFFEQFTIMLPNRVNFSLGSTFVFIAYGELGPAGAFCVELATAVVPMLRAKRPVQRALNFGQLLVSLWVMHLATSTLALGTPHTLRHFAALLLGSLAFFAANTLLLSNAFALLWRRPLRIVVGDVLRESHVGMLGALVLLLPLLYTFTRGGWPTLILFCGCLFAFRYAVNLYIEQKRVHLDALAQLSALLESRMGVGENHARRVAQLARRVAESLKLPAAEVDVVYSAAILHDIGEAELPARVVAVMARKVIAPLADVEEYRRHPELGETIVNRIEGMEAPAKLIRHHHEAWDGSGYPDGLKGAEIPLGARILAAAEEIEQVGGSPEERVEAIERLSGTKIDPGLVKALSDAVRKEGRTTATAAALAKETEVTLLQNKLMQTVRSSRLLKTMGVGHVLSFDRSGFSTFLGERAYPPSETELRDLAERALRSQLPTRHHVIHEDRAYDVYCIPSGEDVASVLLFDLSEALAVEREETRRIFKAYRDVMVAATRDKLVLMDEEECAAAISEGEMLFEMELSEVSDGAAARRMLDEHLRAAGCDGMVLFRLKVCVSEAVTNAFKHAGRGHVAALLHEGQLRVVVSDHGAGIPYEILPKAVLTEGYSTQVSLGKGFAVMLKYLDRIRLHTSAQGTTIILEHSLDKADSGEQAGSGTLMNRGQTQC